MEYQVLFNIIIYASIYALISIGFTIIYRVVGFFHFAHGAIYALGAYVALFFYAEFKVWIPICFLVGLLVAALVGLLVNILVYEKLRCRNASNLTYLLTSFGVFILVQNLLQILFGASVVTMRSDKIFEGHSLGPVIVTDYQIAIIFFATITTIAISIIMASTKIGLMIRALADDYIGSYISGLNVTRIINYTFLIGSTMAGMAGILISFETNLNPTMGLNAIMKGIVASIIGGIGTIKGAIVGAILIALIESLTSWFLRTNWKDFAVYFIFLFILYVRPQGIFGHTVDIKRI